ncbi:unnamed protein product [Chrysodeixis includens]|uniref:Peptidase S1 domain-containing protein n=1 Tax=Chrysodeixis includens TaxID=689277 RepID=A0A9P0FRR6_CHRIL|nr:unnamed protein product [Chrysodeixis includens]
MNDVVNTLIFVIFFLLRVNGVPSGLKIISSRYVPNEIQYPFIVKLERQIIISEVSDVATDSVHICTGAALSASLALTAGHCIDSVNPSKALTDNLRIKCVIRYGPDGLKTADVTSVIRHSSYKYRPPSWQNDIGLVRTKVMQNLVVFGKISPMDINILGGQIITLVGFEPFNNNASLENPSRKQLSFPMKALRARIVRSDKRNQSTVPGVCEVRRCMPSPVQVCPEASGSPMLHSTGIVGINTLSLGNILYCSTHIKTGLIDTGIITPTTPYSDWISFNIYNDIYGQLS